MHTRTKNWTPQCKLNLLEIIAASMAFPLRLCNLKEIDATRKPTLSKM